ARRSAGGRAQLWVMPIGGSAPKRVSSLRNGVSNCVWSPSGALAACLSRTGPSDSLPRGMERSDVRHYTHLSYKFNDTGWFDDRRSHIWIIDQRSGSARQLTEGEAWNDTDPQWAPDGTRIAFVSNRTGNEYEQDRNSDVWVIPVAGGSLTRISTASGPDNAPRWSPDGKFIAFVSAAQEEDPPH